MKKSHSLRSVASLVFVEARIYALLSRADKCTAMCRDVNKDSVPQFSVVRNLTQLWEESFCAERHCTSDVTKLLR